MASFSLRTERRGSFPVSVPGLSRREGIGEGEPSERPGGRLPFVAVAVAVAAAWMFMTGGSPSSATPVYLTRLDLASSMEEVIAHLGLEPGEATTTHRFASRAYSDVRADRRALLERLDRTALLRGFADRSFRPATPVRWGEALFHWGRLVRWLGEQRGGVLPRRVSPGQNLEIPAAWAWLRADLDRLARVEVVDAPLLADLRLEAVVDRAHWQEIVARTIQAFQPAKAGSSSSSSFRPAPLISSVSTPVAPTPKVATTPESLPVGPVLTIEVRDSINRQPVAGAQVVVNGRPLAPSPNGRFQLPLPVAGSPLDLLFTAAGHASLRLRHIAGTRSELSILLKPLRAILTLRLQSAADRQPVRGASVKVGDRLAASDGRGQAVFRGLGPGYHSVEVAASGFQPMRQLVFLEESGSTRLLRLQPQLGQ